MSHLEKIQSLLEGGHREQAAALIETLDDPQIDEFVLERIKLSERELPLLKGKYKRAFSPDVSTEALWRILARSTSDRAKEIVAFEAAVIHDLTNIGVLEPSKALQLVALGCRLLRDGAHPPYATIDASRLERIAVPELTLLGYDFQGAKASVGPAVTALSLFACQGVVLGAAPNLDHLAYTADKVAHHAQIPPNLVSLQIDHATKLQTLGGLREQPRLERVFLRNNPALSDLSDLAHAPALTRVVLQLDAMESIEWVAKAELREAELAGCGKLKSIAALEGKSLERFSLSGCRQLQSLDGFPSVTQGVLDLSGCKRIRTLDPVVGKIDVRCVDLRGCESLQSLEPLEGTNAYVALAQTPFGPKDVSEKMRERCTWAAKPNLELMAQFG